ncbi:MAG: hypothetical protein R2939_15880 [Kofleriaceae bacterium]
MVDEHDDGLSADERRALEALPAMTPLADFAARVVAARASAPAPVVVPPPAGTEPRGRTLTTASVVVAGACVAALGIALVRSSRSDAVPASTGEVEATGRRSIAVGTRAVAVAEAGAALRWQVAAAGAEVEQRTGDVFYRVERGGAFVVHTPAGDVRVTGTCFRVELLPGGDALTQEADVSKKQAVIGGAVGAALAAAAVVSVYEGGVVVANPHGSQAASAGQRVVIGADGAPVLDGSGVEASGAVAVGGLAREALLAQNAAQRQQIASLTAEVARLREGGASGGPTGGPRRMGRDADDGDGRPWFDPSPELLAQMAAECHVRFDLPPMMETEPFQVPARRADSLGVTADELTAINAALADVHRAWATQVRALYLEATGDAAGADALSPQAMSQEIQDKSPPGEEVAIRRRIAQERAGLATPPADLSRTQPIERYLRGLASLGDRAEQALASAIGPERARALRADDQGLFGFRMEMAGCPDEEGGDATELER